MMSRDGSLELNPGFLETLISSLRYPDKLSVVAKIKGNPTKYLLGKEKEGKMKNIKILRLSQLVSVSFILPLTILASCQNQKVVNISDAINQDMIKVEAKGAGPRDVRLTIERITKEKFKVLIPVGTYFVANGNFQNMIAWQEKSVDLTTTIKRTTVIPACSVNLFKHIPKSSDEFDIRSSPESEDLRKLMIVIWKKNTGEAIAQVAVAIVTDDVSLATLNSGYVRIPGGGEPAFSVEDVIRAMKIVEEAGIDITKKNIYREKIAAIRV